MKVLLSIALLVCANLAHADDHNANKPLPPKGQQAAPQQVMPQKVVQPVCQPGKPCPPSQGGAIQPPAPAVAPAVGGSSRSGSSSLPQGQSPQGQPAQGKSQNSNAGPDGKYPDPSWKPQEEKKH